MCPAHFHFVLATYWTMSVTLVLCLIVVLRILPSIHVSDFKMLYSSGYPARCLAVEGFLWDWEAWCQYTVAG